jgi:hypothetical protein
LNVFKSYKAILTYSSAYGGQFEYNIVSLNQFSTIKLNEQYVSEIVENVSCNFNVSLKCIDDFKCFMFQNRIVLIEKFLEDQNKMSEQILKTVQNFWPSAEYGVDWNESFNGTPYISLPGFICNIVVMNNGSTYTVPIIRR